MRPLLLQPDDLQGTPRAGIMDIKREQTRHEYARRIEKAKRHIALHLQEDLTLADLAAEAAFSDFHFHRIFTALAGETPAQYLRRLRLEMAANRLPRDDRSTIAAIALECGFHNPTVFTRSFKQWFGVTPESYRRGAAAKKHATKPRIEKPFDRSAVNRTAVVSFKPERYLFFSRTGPYDQSLVSFYRSVERRTRFLRAPEKYRLLGITLDNPHITPQNLLRFELGVPAAEGIPSPADGENREFAPGITAVYPFNGFPFHIDRGFDDLYAFWLPESGYQPSEYPAFLIHHDDRFHSILPRKTRTDICLPIKPL